MHLSYQAQASIAKANILDDAYSSSFNKIYRLTSVPGSTFSEYDTAVTARTGKQQVTRLIFWTRWPIPICTPARKAKLCEKE